MNNLQACTQAGNMPTVRTIPEIEADILAQKRTIGASIVFIGKALIEAKSQLTHGEWGEWLRTRVNFSQSSAENYMRISREFGEGSALLDLPYSKVLALLSVPKEERERFAEENAVEDKSAREIQRLIRERDEAQRRAADEAVSACEFRRRSEQAEKKIRELEARKPERVEIEVAPEDYRKVMAERHDLEGRVIKAEEAVQLMIAERNDMLTQMAREIASAEEERDDAIAALEAEREGGNAGADPLDVVPFCDTCSALLNRLYAAPYSGALLRTKTDDELERYEMNVQLIMDWARKTREVLDEIRDERGITYDFCIA